jgi:hypothetical protein
MTRKEMEQHAGALLSVAEALASAPSGMTTEVISVWASLHHAAAAWMVAANGAAAMEYGAAAAAKMPVMPPAGWTPPQKPRRP